jgi:hypothetical protein
MKGVAKKSIKKLSYTPENVGGGCMTGRVMTDAETKKVSSFIAQYKANKKPPAVAKPNLK